MPKLKNLADENYIFPEVDIVLLNNSELTVNDEILDQLLLNSKFNTLKSEGYIQIVNDIHDDQIEVPTRRLTKSIIVESDAEIVPSCNMVLTEDHINLTLPEIVNSGDIFAIYCPDIYTFKILSNANSEQQLICAPFKSIVSEKGKPVELISIADSGNLLLFIALQKNKIHFVSQNSCKYQLNRGYTYDLVYTINKDTYRGSYIINTGTYTKELRTMLNLKNVSVTDVETYIDPLSLRFDKGSASISYLKCFEVTDWIVSFDIYPDASSLDSSSHYLFMYSDLMAIRIRNGKLQYKVYPNKWTYGSHELNQQWYSIYIEAKDKTVRATLNDEEDLVLGRSKFKTKMSNVIIGCYKEPNRYPFLGYMSNIKIDCMYYEEAHKIEDIIPLNPVSPVKI